MFSFSPEGVFALHSHPLSRNSGLRARGALILGVTSVLSRPLALLRWTFMFTTTRLKPQTGYPQCFVQIWANQRFEIPVFPRYSNVKTGSRIVRMVVEREISSQQSIRGYPCRVWYKGQPIRCNICREVRHLAASCPKKGLCRRCKEPGHTAGQCTKA